MKDSSGGINKCIWNISLFIIYFRTVVEPDSARSLPPAHRSVSYSGSIASSPAHSTLILTSTATTITCSPSPYCPATQLPQFLRSSLSSPSTWSTLGFCLWPTPMIWKWSDLWELCLWRRCTWSIYLPARFFISGLLCGRNSERSCPLMELLLNRCV